MPAVPTIPMRVETLGVVVTLDVDGDGLARAVADAWEDCIVGPEATVGARTTAPIRVKIGGWDTADVSGIEVSEVLHKLAIAVTEAAVATQGDNLVMLDAVAVAARESGAAAILMAAAGTDIAPALEALGPDLVRLARGTVGISADCRVVPARAPSGDYPLTALWILHHDPTHPSDPQFETLPTVDAVAALAADARPLGRLDQPLQRLAGAIRRAGGVRQVTYADPHSVVPHVLASLVPKDNP